MVDAKAPLRILLVEDSELDAELILDELSQDGLVFTAQRVDDEVAFVAAINDFAPDLIVADLSMPDFSGYRALEIAHTKLARVPFIFVSGTMGEDAAVRALRGGATDYVLKHNLTRLASAVRRALGEVQERNARERIEQDLLRAQRYESLALLASGLSHDLRNVLQPISMGACAQDGGIDQRLHPARPRYRRLDAVVRTRIQCCPGTRESECAAGCARDAVAGHHAA